MKWVQQLVYNIINISSVLFSMTLKTVINDYHTFLMGKSHQHQGIPKQKIIMSYLHITPKGIRIIIFLWTY